MDQTKLPITPPEESISFPDVQLEVDLTVDVHFHARRNPVESMKLDEIRETFGRPREE